MTSDRAQEPQDAGQAAVAMEAVDMLWRFNIAAFTGWWNLMVSCLPEHSRLPHSGAHDQLVVPEPLEETGERALFA
ncbi:MAG: hypothetical protein V4459_06970 [Pseudomonadota bacterium]